MDRSLLIGSLRAEGWNLKSEREGGGKVSGSCQTEVAKMLQGMCGFLSNKFLQTWTVACFYFSTCFCHLSTLALLSSSVACQRNRFGTFIYKSKSYNHCFLSCLMFHVIDLCIFIVVWKPEGNNTTLLLNSFKTCRWRFPLRVALTPWSVSPLYQRGKDGTSQQASSPKAQSIQSSNITE